MYMYMYIQADVYMNSRILLKRSEMPFSIRVSYRGGAGILPPPPRILTYTKNSKSGSINFVGF